MVRTGTYDSLRANQNCSIPVAKFAWNVHFYESGAVGVVLGLPVDIPQCYTPKVGLDRSETFTRMLTGEDSADHIAIRLPSPF